MRGLLYSIILVTIFLSVGCSNNEAEEKLIEEQVDLPQLTNDYTDAATMILVNVPPTQPKDHIDRWNPQLQEQSCLMCHANIESGARPLPDDHFYENNREKEVFRTYCIQCHVEQKDSKPAFNLE